MKITIMNYENKKIDVEIPDNKLYSVDIAIISGDEIAIATYNNGDMQVYDSAALLNLPRVLDFYDGKSCLYNALWDDAEKAERMACFNNRENSYDWE